MKKVLIFGLGHQGKKYINHFIQKGFIVSGVKKNTIKFNNIDGLEKIYSYNEILELGLKFINNFDFIIVAVKPIGEQEKIIKFLSGLNKGIKIIIEKPVCNSLKLLESLKKNNNYYFFIDEVILYNYYIKIFTDSDKILIKSDNDIDILEHVIGGFLLFKNFNKILDNLCFIFNKTKSTNKILFYELLYKKYKLICEKGNFKINNKNFYRLKFQDSLDYLLSLTPENNTLYKRNYILLKKKLNSINMNYE